MGIAPTKKTQCAVWTRVHNSSKYACSDCLGLPYPYGRRLSGEMREPRTREPTASPQYRGICAAHRVVGRCDHRRETTPRPHLCSGERGRASSPRQGVIPNLRVWRWAPTTSADPSPPGRCEPRKHKGKPRIRDDYPTRVRASPSCTRGLSVHRAVGPQGGAAAEPISPTEAQLGGEPRQWGGGNHCLGWLPPPKRAAGDAFPFITCCFSFPFRPCAVFHSSQRGRSLYQALRRSSRRDVALSAQRAISPVSSQAVDHTLIDCFGELLVWPAGRGGRPADY